MPRRRLPICRRRSCAAVHPASIISAVTGIAPVTGCAATASGTTARAQQAGYDAGGFCRLHRSVLTRNPPPQTGGSPMRSRGWVGAKGRSALQRALPQREHLVPGLFGRQRVVDGALVEREAVLGAGEHLELVLDAVLVEEPFELARDVLRHAAVGFGEGVIEFALDFVELQMRRVLLVGDDADAIERGRWFDAVREGRRG